jgi:threonine synthase
MPTRWWNAALIRFECAASCTGVVPPELEPVCPRCGKALLARYDLEYLARSVRRDALGDWGQGLWRYRAMLPFAPDFPVVSLGEGGTPLLRLERLGRSLGIDRLWLKDEAGNPTQSFKARGLALAVSGAVALGKQAIALPSAGNAGSAAAAYAAAAGIACRITVPEETPEVFMIEQRSLGAEVRSVPGTIAEAGRALAEWAPAAQWWNVATFKEPFRLEGKKTLGYEIAEQSNWRLPDLIFYPTGGGTGLVGMWRAFLELKELGWIEGPLPRLVAVQSRGCAPVSQAFEAGERTVRPWPEARTIASGLRVPAPFAGELILAVLRESQGFAISVEEDEILEAMAVLAESQGIFACPEGAASLAALRRLCGEGRLSRESRVVLYNTGSGLKYPEAWRAALAARAGRPAPRATP